MAGIASLMAAAVFALLPTSVSVMGTTASCRPPVVEVLDRATSGGGGSFADGQCAEQSLTRIVVAAAVLVIGVGGGVVLVGLGWPEPARRETSEV